MSTTLNLDADELRRLAAFIEALTAATEEYGVRMAHEHSVPVSIGDVEIRIAWDGPNSRYTLYDQLATS